MIFRDLLSSLRGHDSDNTCGLYNLGNSCFCNVVVQSLFHCRVFRDFILDGSVSNDMCDDALFNSLSVLFQGMSGTGDVDPTSFVKLSCQKLGLKFGLQHDAQEFLLGLINYFVDSFKDSEDVYPFMDMFQGVVNYGTKCLMCEEVTQSEEMFFDLCLDVDDNTSVSYCLSNYFSSEKMRGSEKYYCESCCCRQEAERYTRVKKLPKILIIQLKRFKYNERQDKFVKIPHRVVFPEYLRILQTIEQNDSKKLYSLVSVVSHIGSSPNHGHYVAFSKTEDIWRKYDDDKVSRLENDISPLYGSSAHMGKRDSNSNGYSYLLFYQETR
eukprot:TRINITY_DN3013_c0_g2_i1.p1 TRINITY_DN3013_c0_g2~~TRINITY_DN3013_c0_g2_i1.p1  ORF type:complete len:326 (-),score=50.47 TRINITY_DN3013_c0_g2_i1:1197-2174(-)